MRWLIGRLAPPPDLPPPPDDGDVAGMLGERLGSLRSRKIDHEIGAAREELSRQKARLLRLGEVRAQRDGALD